MRQLYDACICLLCLFIVSDAAASFSEEVPLIHSLAGEWQIRMDPEGTGFEAKWFREVFAGDPAYLPGTVYTNSLQPASTEGDMINFTPEYPYSGCVWYQRIIKIPDNFRGKQIALFLERCQWETHVWIDNQYQGSQNSLVAPHTYDLADALGPGTHRLTLMVDNANIRRYMDTLQAETKLNCGGHHIWQCNWNGVVGRIELQVSEKLRILSLDAYPDMAGGKVKVRARLANSSGMKGRAKIRASCRLKDSDLYGAKAEEWILELNGDKEQLFEQHLELVEPILLWDEFNPDLYELSLELSTQKIKDSRRITFGMRELNTEGTHMLLNGNRIFLRGTLENFVFPLTGHPPVDVESWRKVISTAKAYGLNFFRFHSCCPPEAAFRAADELGFYFQVELPGTSCPSTDEALEVEEFLSAELARIIENYGNHPSFLTLSMGNEQLQAIGQPDFLTRHQEVLTRKIHYGRKHDPRHLYTATSHPWSPGREDDFFVSAWPVSGEEPLCGIRWGGGTVIDRSRFNTRAPETAFDYDSSLIGLDRPLITHEVGQWSVYPDLREIGRYHGALREASFEMIRDSLRDRGMLKWAGDYTRASGKLALALYKEEIESALRSSDLSGFMLLDIHDYPGQGTSTVGILNALWESKGLTNPEEFRTFCGPVVPLARLAKRVWKNNDIFKADIDVANYSKGSLDGTATWSLCGEDGRIYAFDSIFGPTIPSGGLARIGTVSIPLDGVAAPAKLILRVAAGDRAPNSWEIWVYSPEAPAAIPATITISSRWDKAARDVLRKGGTLLLVPDADQILDPVPGTFTPVFWNAIMKHKQVSKTMGLLCDPGHLAFRGFPTDFHSNWQWWDPVMKSNAMHIEGLPEAVRPIVWVIDSFVGYRKLAMIFEAKVGEGKLLVCSSDIINNLSDRPAARQLRQSLLDYMSSPGFAPDVPVSLNEIGTVLKSY